MNKVINDNEVAYRLMTERSKEVDLSNMGITIPMKYISKKLGTIDNRLTAVKDTSRLSDDGSLIAIKKRYDAEHPAEVKTRTYSGSYYQIKLPNINGEFGYPIESVKIPKKYLDPRFSGMTNTCSMDLKDLPDKLVVESESFNALGKRKIERYEISKDEFIFRIDRNVQLLIEKGMIQLPSKSLQRAKASVSGMKDLAIKANEKLHNIKMAQEPAYSVEVERFNDGSYAYIYGEKETDKGREL